jgi:hypothetical protein
MAEIRPYRETYFARRKKTYTIISLALLAVAATAVAFLFLRSRPSREMVASGEVRSTVSQHPEPESRAMAAGAGGSVTDKSPSEPPPVNVIAGDSGPEEITAAENQGTAGGEAGAEPGPEPAVGEDELVPGYARTREQGVREYDGEVSALAIKADRIDALWQKHRDFCQGTIAVTVGNAYGREWFGIYTTISAADTPECKMMIQEMQALSAEIDTGMEAAWEKAHRAGVYPGQIRAVQQKYFMELDRWNK